MQIEVEGSERELTAFLRALRCEAPPLARVEEVESVPAVPRGAARFSIRRSRPRPGQRQPVPPDTGLCAACEAELFDPGNRRYRFPFITCTDCGPRFTVIEALPYDRERTSMRAFRQCDECLREYRDPADRRYHSETNCCSACGPRVWYEPAGSTDRVDGEPDSNRLRRSSVPAASWPCVAWAAFTWPWTRSMTSRWDGCASGSTGKRSPSR